MLTVTCCTVSGGQSIIISFFCIHCENKNTNFAAIILCTCWWTPGISLRIDRGGLWRIPLPHRVSRSLPLSQSVFSLRILSECLSLPKSKFLVLGSLSEIKKTKQILWTNTRKEKRQQVYIRHALTILDNATQSVDFTVSFY